MGEQERITAKSVDVELDLSDLLVGKKLSLSIVAKDGMAAYAQVLELADLFSNAPAAAQSVVVRELQLSRMGLLAPDWSSLKTASLSACGLRWTNKR